MQATYGRILTSLIVMAVVLTSMPSASRGAGPDPVTPPRDSEAAASIHFADDDPAPPAPAPPNPAPQPWKGLFYNNDFSFKDDPDHAPVLGEQLKDLQLQPDHRFSYGGELRYRLMVEDNRLRTGFPQQNNHQLWRWRQYADWQYSDFFRAYLEVIDAVSFREDLPPLGIDEDAFDITNAFFDVRTFDLGGQTFWFRVGRQELAYGAQRLISPLDWGNTRRTFEGFKLFSRGDTWDFDLFATRPVPVFPESRNKADASRTFSGAYAVYHGLENHTVDLYWLWDREQEPALGRADGSRHTTGLRWMGEHPVTDGRGDVTRLWAAEIEGAFQFGHDNGQNVEAGFATAGVGHTWKDVPWQPSLWGYFDWASGDADPTDNETNTFFHLYPLGHKYLGFFDAVARQNLVDYNIRLAAQPTKKLTLTSWLHFFELDEGSDALYNVVGAPFARDPTDNSSKDVGEELDLTARYVFNPNADVLIGYSWFWDGEFLNNLGRGSQGELFYVQGTLRY